MEAAVAGTAGGPMTGTIFATQRSTMRQRSTRQLRPTLLSMIAACVLWIPAAAPASEIKTEDESAVVFRGPEELPESARDAWAATVFIETRTWHRGSGDRDVATGSGVVIAYEPRDGTVLIATSAHVVPCDSACLVRVVFPASSTGERKSSTRARLLWHDPRQDLALLRSPMPPGTAARIARTAPGSAVAAGGRVLAIGFPDPALAAANPAPRRAKLFSGGLLIDARDSFEADYRAYSSTAIVGRLAPEAVLIHTAELLPGSSGGPLIDATGTVIGINTGSLVPAQGKGCAQAKEADGECCLHLAIALDAVLEKLDTLTP